LLAGLAYFESRLGAKTETTRPRPSRFCCKEVSSERASPLWAMKKGLLLPHANESAVSIQQEKFSAMMFRQLFDQTSGTYSYLLASRAGGEALIIDPVLEKADRYLQLVKELDLKLVKAVDTHLHADHITGLGALRDRTHCITMMGETPYCCRPPVDRQGGCNQILKIDVLNVEGLAHMRAARV